MHNCDLTPPGVIQYNLDNRGFEGGPIPLNINDVCAYMTNGSDALAQYATVNKYVCEAFNSIAHHARHSLILGQYGEPCLDVSYQAMVQEMQNTTWGGPSDGSRQWIWQARLSISLLALAHMCADLH